MCLVYEIAIVISIVTQIGLSKISVRVQPNSGTSANVHNSAIEHA